MLMKHHSSEALRFDVSIQFITCAAVLSVIAIDGSAQVVQLPPTNNPPTCHIRSFESAASDDELRWAEALIFRHCTDCLALDTCMTCDCARPGCTLDPADSYLNTRPNESIWDNLWNGVSAEILDLVEIYEYLVLTNQSFVMIRDRIFDRDTVYSEIVRRSREVLARGLIPQWDEIRRRMMFGFGQRLNSNYSLCPPCQPDCDNEPIRCGLARINHCYHFHAAAAVEPIARFIAFLGRGEAGSIQEEFYSQLNRILNTYEDDWNGRTYWDPAETEYMRLRDNDPTAHGEIAYNHASSIGITYMYLFEYGRDSFYLDRVRRLVMFVDGAVAPRVSGYLCRGYCIWNYSPAPSSRVEDPDHAIEDLRFAVFMNRRGMFDEIKMRAMVTTWLDLGLEGTDCLTCRIDGYTPTGTVARLSDIAPRSLFVLRYDPVLWSKAIGSVPFAPCVPNSSCAPKSGCR